MFDNFKDSIQKKIERNTVKSNLSWTDSKGTQHSEEVILKRSKVPVLGDWGRIYPPINEDGSLNLTNLIFGGKKNLIRLLAIFFILIMIYFWVTGIIGVGSEYLNGQKYIIVEKTAFDKFCSMSIVEGQGEIINIPGKENNLSIFKEYEGDE